MKAKWVRYIKVPVEGEDVRVQPSVQIVDEMEVLVDENDECILDQDDNKIFRDINNQKTWYNKVNPKKLEVGSVSLSRF